MMLRVRLDNCDVVGGVVCFDGVPLSGLGVEVADENSSSRTGTVVVWEYFDGQPVGASLELDYGGDQRVIVDWTAFDQDSVQFGNDDYYTLDGEPFEGSAAFFEGPFLRGLEQLHGGSAWTDRKSYWARDGLLDHYQDEHLLPWKGSVLRVNEQVWRGRGRMYRSDAHVDHSLRVDLDTGPPPRSINGYFEPFSHGHDSFFHARLMVDADASGAVRRLAFQGHDENFDVLARVRPILSLRGDHPLDLATYREIRVARTWAMSMSDALARRVIDALGGPGAFGEVRELKLEQNGWSQDLVEWFLGLPKLTRVDVPQWSDVEPVQEILARVQPTPDKIVVTFKGRLPEDVAEIYKQTPVPGVTQGFVQQPGSGGNAIL